MKTASQTRKAVRPGAVLAIVLTSYLMIVLDISIVVTGLPDIRDGLGLSAIGLAWVQNAYLLMFAGFLMLAARAGDLIGRKRMFVCGLVIFTLSSLVIGLAPSAGVLIAARGVQGIGAAILAPSVLALISTYFPEGEERTKAMAKYSMVAGIGASLGLVLGGIFTDLVSWRVGFLMNVPLGAALILTAQRLLVETPHRPGRFDLAGAATSTLGMGALVYGIVRAAEDGWGDPGTLTLLAAASLLLACFIRIESRAAAPIMPLRLFASRRRVGAYLARMLFLGAMVGFLFFSTLYMQEVLGYSPLEAGLGFLPMTLPTLAAAMMVPRTTARIGNDALLLMALVLGAAGMIWLAQADTGAGYLTAVVLPMILIGIGNGLALGPLTVAGITGVAPHDAGAAAGVINVAHQLGGAVGLSLLVVVFAQSGDAALTGLELLAHRIDTALTVAALYLAAAAIITLVMILRVPLVCARPMAQGHSS